MEVSGEPHAPATSSLGMEATVPIVQKAGWTSEPF